MGINSEKSVEYGDEDDIQLMEDNWGDSSETREWFLEETERYVGYGDSKEGSYKDPVHSSTHQEAVKPDEEGRLSEAPDKGGPLPPRVWRA